MIQGRRSQSLEILSDDLRSMSLSTPSSPSPRPPTAASAASMEAKLSTGSHRGHVHFLSSSAENGNTPNNADIVRNMVEEFGWESIFFSTLQLRDVIFRMSLLVR